MKRHGGADLIVVSRRGSSLDQEPGRSNGAVDLIVTPDGQHVFLEVNPTGEFLWLDDLSAGSISVAIAGVLVAAGRRL